MIAPASLKLDVLRDDGQLAERFRGMIAPASLKRIPLESVHHLFAGFRGMIAPASLKPERKERDGRRLCTVSGA